MKSASRSSTLAMTAAILAAIVPLSSAFSSSPSSPTMTHRSSSSTALSAVINKDFGRAVACAEHFGMCDVDEMASLADKLEYLEGCVYEGEREGHH